MVSSRSLFCALFIALSSLVIGGHGQGDAAEVSDLPGWRLTWHDEFDGRNSTRRRGTKPTRRTTTTTRSSITAQNRHPSSMESCELLQPKIR